MECTQASGLSGELGAMHEALCDYIILLCLGEWLAPTRMVPAATWDSAGMAVDTLALCMMRLCSRGHLSGFQTTSIPGGIPLLQYAGDTTFFIQGSEIAARTLSMMIDVFTDFSGLQLNQAKSTVVGFGLSTEELSRYAEILASPIGTLPLQYLGLSLTDRRLRTQDWQPMMEKVESRLGGWGGGDCSPGAVV